MVMVWCGVVVVRLCKLGKLGFENKADFDVARTVSGSSQV